MTQIEKAQAWFKTNDYTASISDTDLYVTVWNNSLEESIDIHVSTAEIQYRADLWDAQQDTNQSQLPL
jgi:hypothetical protein